MSHTHMPHRLLDDIGVPRILAASTSLGAAAVHLAAGPQHWTEWWAAGAFFFALAAFQAVWGLTVLRTGNRAVLAAGLLVEAGALAVWATSRTTGLPFGPFAGAPEEMGRAGLTAAALEAVLILAVLWAFASRNPKGFATSSAAVLVVGAVAAGVTGVSVPAVQAAMVHSHAEHGGHSHGDEDADGGHHDSPGHEESTAPAERDTQEPSRVPGSSASAEDGERKASSEPGHHDDDHHH
ncbi:hypothetical protein [Streptomyces sp. TR06-5]|uniref:hypothetical protein n=1 Tax=unclassified Streptomyces TaxID=2593676 RepID=UPI0039A127A3